MFLDIYFYHRAQLRVLWWPIPCSSTPTLVFPQPHQTLNCRLISLAPQSTLTHNAQSIKKARGLHDFTEIWPWGTLPSIWKSWDRLGICLWKYSLTFTHWCPMHQTAYFRTFLKTLLFIFKKWARETAQSERCWKLTSMSRTHVWKCGRCLGVANQTTSITSQ